MLQSSGNYYNILALDGGGAKGLITAIVIQEIEKYAREYATSKNYNVPVLKDENDKEKTDRVHMTQIFDMIAGTSTGSIISAALTYPSPGTINSTNR